MREKVARPDLSMGEMATRQHGVISTSQLIGVGIDKDRIRRRLQAGRLHRLHRGVYAVGHAAISEEARWMAAVLAVGGAPSQAGEILRRWGAAIGHRSAAELWGLVGRGEGPVDVLVGGDGGRMRRRGIRIHRSLTLLPGEVTLRGGIPVTTPARTISDLRRATRTRGPAAVSPRELRRAVRQADVLGLPIAEVPERDRTRSDLERDFLRLCRRYGLPHPEVNVRVGRDLVDFLWRERRLVVETDGYRYHRGRAAFQDDRGRDLRLRTAGFDVIRVSEKQVDEESERVVEAVAAALRVGADGDQGP